MLSGQNRTISGVSGPDFPFKCTLRNAKPGKDSEYGENSKNPLRVRARKAHPSVRVPHYIPILILVKLNLRG